MNEVPEAIRKLVEQWIADGRLPQPAIAWPRGRWAADFPASAEVLDSLPERLDRVAVIKASARAAESPQAAIDAFLAVMAWGYGDTVGYGRYRTANILASRPEAGERLQSVAQLLADADVFSAHHALSSPALAQLRGLGPSFGSKVLYFFQPPDRKPRALILDAFVAGWLAREAGHIFDGSQWSLESYRRYLGKMHEWAETLGIEPDELEMVIFRAEAARRGSQWATGDGAGQPEPAAELWVPPAVPATGLPFAAYPGGGRVLQGAPRWGNGSARRGYGVDVLAWCGYECAYCGLDMSSFEGWLQFSVDHVIPQQMQALAGYRSEWVLDSINLVAACGACNGFLNRDPATGPPPATLEDFCDRRDAVFLLRREKIENRRDAERVWFNDRIAPAAVEIAARRAVVSDAALGMLAAWAPIFADPALSAGEWDGGERLPDGSITMPWYRLSDEIRRFDAEMYAAGMVRGVAWMQWAATPLGRSLLGDPAAIAGATPGELVYIITTVIRGERFGDGTIAGALEHGLLVAAARRAEDLLADLGDPP